ncbi:TonB-dependent receptor [Sphingomonas sanguinis]|uniref:TonB-dependent receptor n=1 Tax=Sphingomonas sanguinis TaxID=33051 RepID=A0A147HTY2_9SPHN|nr:TonB-dependent receptor [Sphingomonas sanguinis]KTT68351.1 TonB-dependent receptor [Sphingomonas sanguinis]
MISFDPRFAGRCLASSALVLLLATPALAADPVVDPAKTTAPDDQKTNADGSLNEVIVTAEKRPQSLQKTPIAISVLSSEDLANRHVQSLVDLQDGAIPSLRVAPFYSRNSALIMNIRGIGVLADSNQPARDQGVGVYIDGVYLGRAQGLGTALYDIESIEVLKGPQGTLFGRNTEGGAVSIVTKKPTGEFGLSATAGIGNYGSHKIEGHLNLPEWHNFAVKLDGIVTKRNGLVDNPLPGQADFNGFDRHGAHVEVLWKPQDGVSADYAFDTSYDASTPLYLQTITAGTLTRAPALPLQPNRVRTASIGVPQQESIGKTHGHRLTLGLDLAPGLQLKSITAYRELDQSQYDNGGQNSTTFKPNGSFSRYSLAGFTQNQFSQEIQLIGDAPRLKYVAGAMAYREHTEDNAQAFNTMVWNANGTAATVASYNIATVAYDRASRITTRSIGAFGQATWTPAILDDRLHLTGGARYTRDMKKGQLFIVNGATPNVDGVIAPRGLDAAWSRVDPLLTLAYDVTDAVHVYGKWSEGYKSGGANSRSLRYAPFNPETLSMFEIGAKSEFLDHRVRLNLAAYTGAYKSIQIDFQANYFKIVNGQVVQTNRTTIETTNAPGTGRAKGFEAELTVAAATGLTLGASYSYNDVTIPATVNPFPQGVYGVVVTTPIKIYPVYTPAHAASGSIDYERPLGDYSLVAHLDANYDSGFFANYNDPAVGVSQPKGDPGFIVNGRIGITDIALNDTGARLTLSAWARNLFNEQHLFYKGLNTATGVSGFFNEARTYGLEAGVKF